MKLADGEERAIRFVATTTYWSSDGKPISAQEFLNRLFGKLAAVIINEDALRTAWIAPDNRESSQIQKYRDLCELLNQERHKDRQYRFN